MQPCPAGFFGNDTLLHSPQCSGLCPAGVDPIPCGNPDAYCPVGTSAPLPVPLGYYSLGLDATHRQAIGLCDEGHYCISGSKYECPPGTYSLSQGPVTACSDLCPIGRYCPQGSVVPRLCPPGSHPNRTIVHPAKERRDYPNRLPCRLHVSNGKRLATGHSFGFLPRHNARPYHFGDDHSAHPVSPWLLLHTGYYLIGPAAVDNFQKDVLHHALWVISELPPGSPRVSALVNAPPEPSAPPAALRRDPSKFCPINVYAPQPVGLGNYSIPLDSSFRTSQAVCEPGYYCIGGVRRPCPAGTFGTAFGLTTAACSGLCAPGYYCPQGSALATANECGRPQVYCPEVVASGYCGVGPTATTHASQVAAPAGSYAFEGQCHLCPGGYYGSDTRDIRHTCSGECAAGYFCPAGSTSPFERTCGLGYFCPPGAPQPTLVASGYYSYIATTDACGPGLYRGSSTSFAVLQLAAWSTVEVTYGDALFPFASCVPCPMGTFKTDAGDDFSLCQPCPLSADRTTCSCFRLSGGITYDPSETALYFTGAACVAIPISTAPASALPGNTSWTKSQQAPCEPGYYCIQGARFPCPAGRYGAFWMETRPTCSDACRRGYYCPIASTRDAAKPCGAPSLYCPPGSPYPSAVSTGYYSVDSVTGRFSDPTLRDAQEPCEPGFYCQYGLKAPCPGGRYGSLALETAPQCEGMCQRGYYCPPGSSRPTQNACGNASVVCRRGSAAPVAVATGYYSGGDTLPLAPDFGWTRSSVGTVHGGFRSRAHQVHFASMGTERHAQRELTAVYPSFANRRARVFVLQVTTSGGYYCPSGSASAQAVPCGNVGVYCPPGSSQPMAVTVGYYSTGGTNVTRPAQTICPVGSFCRHGVVYQCPPGTYGDTPGLTEDMCSGWCAAGYFCPFGTTSATALACNATSYSTPGLGACVACPVARSPMPCHNSRACCH
ncbi:hypothetical protein ACHHYP_20382 [Achlya hypogyna]|uniref:Tyrosine-protein kinase ephrin type A/B receptor-like domain-containing protein n=1 Tax=Achlya hypogyna TaxID=1202772 RepID=A0A1V9YP52_ACHHY|nr:hypothetical protein ACHHYP_20382 [Achlya hypogyna]